MKEDNSIDQLHTLDKYALLLFSHLKLNGILKVDVLELAHTLTNSKTILYDFDLRETIEGPFMLDIDSMLMSAYLQGYISYGKREILLEDDYIKTNVLPKFPKETNDVFKHIAEVYMEKMKDRDELSDRDFVGDLFVNYNINGRRKKS